MESNKEYFDVVRKQCFDCINEDSRVLEIGPQLGDFTDLILEKNPKNCTLVEASKDCVEMLSKKFPNSDIIYGDIFEEFPSLANGYDVVVAFGVIYHWNSPFRFLEDVVNIIKPRFICLDNPENYFFGLRHEKPNVPGNNQVIDSEKRTVNVSFNLRSTDITNAMNDLKYNTLSVNDMSKFYYDKHKTKSKSVMFKFERQTL